MAFNVYDNPQSVTIGSTSISGVQSITTNVSYSEIHAAGDDDTVESVARYATARVSGTITLLDPISADAAKGLTGTLSFKINEVSGGTDKTISIATASIGGYDANTARDSAGSVTVPFIAEALPTNS